MHHTRLITAILLMSLGGQSYAQTNAVPAEVQDQTYLFEVIRHLYRWYLDEHDIEAAIPAPQMDIWLRDATPTDLDKDDKSRMVELGIPVFKIRVMLKKTDYRIPELDVHIKSRNYKIIEVARDPQGASAPAGALETTLCRKTMKEFLFKTRAQRDPLDPALGRHLRAAVARQMSTDDRDIDQEIHEIHIAPLSPVANELWVFWETGRRLIRVASDIELTDPAMWEHERLAVRIFDIDLQTVVSLAETPGSNAYLTRDQVGRALFNCIVLGEHREIPAE